MDSINDICTKYNNFVKTTNTVQCDYTRALICKNLERCDFTDAYRNKSKPKVDKPLKRVHNIYDKCNDKNIDVPYDTLSMDIINKINKYKKLYCDKSKESEYDDINAPIVGITTNILSPRQCIKLKEKIIIPEMEDNMDIYHPTFMDKIIQLTNIGVHSCEVKSSHDYTDGTITIGTNIFTKIIYCNNFCNVRERKKQICQNKLICGYLALTNGNCAQALLLRKQLEKKSMEIANNILCNNLHTKYDDDKIALRLEVIIAYVMVTNIPVCLYDDQTERAILYYLSKNFSKTKFLYMTNKYHYFQLSNKCL